MSQIEKDMQALASEVYILTGQKIETSDPVIIAALFQSKLIKDSHNASLAQFNEAIDSMLGNVGTSIQCERQKLAAIKEAQDSAFRQASTLARNVIKLEIPKLREEFHEVALEVMRETNGIVIKSQTRKILIAACALVVISFGVGIHIGSKYFSTQSEITNSDSSVSSDKK